MTCGQSLQKYIGLVSLKNSALMCFSFPPGKAEQLINELLYFWFICPSILVFPVCLFVSDGECGSVGDQLLVRGRKGWRKPRKFGWEQQSAGYPLLVTHQFDSNNNHDDDADNDDGNADGVDYDNDDAGQPLKHHLIGTTIFICTLYNNMILDLNWFTLHISYNTLWYKPCLDKMN